MGIETINVTGQAMSTGAPIFVSLGNKPQKVTVITGTNMVEFDAAGGNQGIKTVTAGTRSVLSANGITLYEGGDVIVFDPTRKRWEDERGNAVAAKFVDALYLQKVAGDPTSKCIGDTLAPNPYPGTKLHVPAGFCIGADTDINPAAAAKIIWEITE